MGDSQNPFGTTVLLPPDYMVGAIIIWSGAVVDIPNGWQLCDGTNGTPDLRNRFIVGQGSGNPVGSTGGTKEHTHDFTGNGHTHNVGDSGPPSMEAGPDIPIATSSRSAVGTTDLADGRPPFYSLAYIQRMSL